MHVSSTYPFHHTQIPDRGEELNYYFIEDNIYPDGYGSIRSNKENYIDKDESSRPNGNKIGNIRKTKVLILKLL